MYNLEIKKFRKSLSKEDPNNLLLDNQLINNNNNNSKSKNIFNTLKITKITTLTIIKEPEWTNQKSNSSKKFII